MKIRHFAFALPVLAVLLAGCAKEKPLENARMTISRSEMAFDRTPSEGQTVMVTSNRKWKVRDLPAWVKATVGGKDIQNEVMPTGATEVMISLDENTGDDRIYELLFNGGNIANKTLSISQAGVPVVYDKIADIKELLGANASINIPDGMKIKGTVVSNVSLSNQTSKKNIIVQDSTGGITLRLTENSTYSFGDVVTIDLSGQELTTYNKAYQINNISTTLFTIKEKTSTVTPIEADITKFLNNEYEGCYIALKKVEVATSDMNNTWVKFSGTDSSHTSINFIFETGGGFTVFSSKYATYGRETVAQGAGTICGVSTRNNDDIQLMFGQSTDYASLTEPRFEAYSESLTVSEALEKAANTDVTVCGRVIKVVKDGFILNDGEQNSIYIYNGNRIQYDVAENDIVEVKGNISIYGATEIIPYNVSGSDKAVAPTPDLKITELTPAQIASYSGKASVPVSFKGVFNYDASGPYYNIELEGVSVKGSLKVIDGLDITGFHGKEVTVTGFFVGSTSKYFNVAITSASDIDDSYLSIDPASTKIKADSTFVKFNITTDKGWTLTATEGYTVSPSSGEGNAEITVTFAKNTDKTYEKVGTVTVTPTSGTSAPAIFTVTQKTAFDASARHLTNEEIVAGIEAAYAKTHAAEFQEVEITSEESGIWKGVICFSAKDGKITSPYVWMRNRGGSSLYSPVFDANISKIRIKLNEKTGTSIRTFIAIPTSAELPSGSYSNSSFPDQYGKKESTGTVNEIVEIEFTGDTKDFNLVVLGGSVYFDSIDIILK